MFESSLSNRWYSLSVNILWDSFSVEVSGSSLPSNDSIIEMTQIVVVLPSEVIS